MPHLTCSLPSDAAHVASRRLAVRSSSRLVHFFLPPMDFAAAAMAFFSSCCFFLNSASSSVSSFLLLLPFLRTTSFCDLLEVPTGIAAEEGWYRPAQSPWAVPPDPGQA